MFMQISRRVYSFVKNDIENFVQDPQFEHYKYPKSKWRKLTNCSKEISTGHKNETKKRPADVKAITNKKNGPSSKDT